MRWSDSGRVVLEVALARLMLAPVGPAPAMAAANTIASPAVGGRVAEERAASPSKSTPPPPAREPAVRSASVAPTNSERPPSLTAGGDLRSRPPEAASTEGFDPFEHEELPAAIARAPQEPVLSTPGSVQTPPASVPETGERDALTMEQIQRRWPVVIEELKRSRSSAITAALLAEAQPVNCEGQTLMLGFRHSTLRDKWDRGDHKQRLQDALISVFGHSLPVRTTMMGDAAPPASSSPAPPGRSTVRNGGSPADEAVSQPLPIETRPPGGRPAPSPDLLQGDALLHEVVAAFEGQIVEPETR
jgi:hypothetical protein